MKTADCTADQGEMREKTAGNASVFVEIRRNLFKFGYLICMVKMFAFFFRVLIGILFTNREVVFPPRIVRNTLFIKEFCFNFKP